MKIASASVPSGAKVARSVVARKEALFLTEQPVSASVPPFVKTGIAFVRNVKRKPAQPARNHQKARRVALLGTAPYQQENIIIERKGLAEALIVREEKMKNKVLWLSFLALVAITVTSFYLIYTALRLLQAMQEKAFFGAP